MNWNNPANTDRLRALWAEGLSTQKIADRMGISKNMVVGKAHRLHLPPRPSPIKRDSETRGHRPAPPPKAPKTTLPRLKSIDRLPNEDRAMIKDERQPMLPRVVAKKPPVARFATCQFIAGDPRKRPVLYCGAPTMLGRPYCEKCWSRTHVAARAEEAMAA